MCEPPSESELNTIKNDCRSRIERFIIYIYSLYDKKINSDSLHDKKLNSADIIELQLRSNKAESLYKQYEDVLTQMLGHTQWNKSDHHFEAQFYKALAISKDLINKHNNNHTKSNINCDRNNNSSPFQFPAIQLPKFDGRSNKWLDFRETFTAFIHSNNLIDDMDKYRYLRASMEGSAAVLIQSVDYSANNYTAAWKLLNETYNNLNKLVQCHLSSMFNIEVIQESSSTALKGFIDHLLKNLRALELLGQPVKKWDTLLLYMLSSKLDQNTRREWEKYLSKEDSRMTVDAFTQFLRNHAYFMEAREMNGQESCLHDDPKTEHKQIPASLQLATSSFNTITPQEPASTERSEFTDKFLRIFKSGIPLVGKYNTKKRMIISLEMLLISEKDFVDFLNGLPHTSSETEVLKAVLKHVGRFAAIASLYKI